MIKQDFARLNKMQRVLARYARGPRFESRSGLVLPLPRDIWWLSVGPCSDCEQQSDSLISFVPAWFRADSGTYLCIFKQGGGGNCHGSIVWIKCSHGTGELLGSSPGRAMCFFLLYGIYPMTSFDVEVIEINTITEDSVPAYKKTHIGVGAKIIQESDLFSNFNSENIINVFYDHCTSLGITCAWLHDH